jgi:Acetyltransferase (GNAT) family
LGTLFYGAFLRTIDDAGQVESEYASKAGAILGGRYGEWIPAASWAIEEAGNILSACLVCDYKPYGCPVIAVVATTPSRKRSGNGGTLMNAALLSLAMLGYTECCAMITMGNDASERLFSSCGFVPKAD